jgi:hypothetical protein
MMVAQEEGLLFDLCAALPAVYRGLDRLVKLRGPRSDWAGWCREVKSGWTVRRDYYVDATIYPLHVTVARDEPPL